MNNPYNLSVGQTVWIVGGYMNKELRSAVIESVGRKYFTIVSERNRRWHLDTLNDDSDTNYPVTVYLDPKTYQEKVEHEEIIKFFHRFFSFTGGGYKNASLETLRQLKQIVDTQ